MRVGSCVGGPTARRGGGIGLDAQWSIMDRKALSCNTETLEDSTWHCICECLGRYFGCAWGV